MSLISCSGALFDVGAPELDVGAIIAVDGQLTVLEHYLMSAPPELDVGATLFDVGATRFRCRRH